MTATMICARAMISSLQTNVSRACSMKKSGPSAVHRKAMRSKEWAHSRRGISHRATATQSDDVFKVLEAVEQPDRSRGDLPRFHVDSLPTSEGLIAQVRGEEYSHMVKVLRLKTNDRVEIFDGRGGIVNGQLVAIKRQAAEVLCLGSPRVIPSTEPHWHVAAAFGTLKGGRGDWLVEKCTELGARSLIPLLTQRSQSKSGDRSERWRRIAMAATKQCQRLHCLNVPDAIRLRDYLPQVSQVEVALVASAGADPLVQSLAKISRTPKSGILFVGPEGDFTDDEIKLLIEAGATAVSLGSLRLRVETAAVAMLAAVMLFGDTKVSHLQRSRT